MVKNCGVSIFLSDENDIDLKNILQVLSVEGRNSNWKISNVECFGEKAEILHQISDEGKIISGYYFYEIADAVYQTIEGEFEAFKANENAGWCVIRAVDGTVFDVETKDHELLNKIRHSFTNIRELKY